LLWQPPRSILNCEDARRLPRSALAADAPVVRPTTEIFMTQARYYRLALAVPLVLPALIWAVISILPLVAHTGGHWSIPDWVVMPFFLTAMGAWFYAIPYAAVAFLLWRKSPDWTVTQFRRWLWSLPALFTLAATLVVATANIVGNYDPEWLDYVREVARNSLMVGYGQALVIALGEWIATRCGWLEVVATAA
jgi:hypothetical protein